MHCKQQHIRNISVPRSWWCLILNNAIPQRGTQRANALKHVFLKERHENHFLWSFGGSHPCPWEHIPSFTSVLVSKCRRNPKLKGTMLLSAEDSVGGYCLVGIDLSQAFNSQIWGRASNDKNWRSSVPNCMWWRGDETAVIILSLLSNQLLALMT